MIRFSATTKTILAGSTLALLGITAALSVRALPENRPATTDAKAGPDDHTMFGGTTARNMVNLTAKGVVDKVEAEGSNQLWKVALGSRAYGGPIVAAGKIFVGTNNEQPRNKRDVDKNGDPIDKGIVMCFDEKSGKFLWQAVHDKLPNGIVTDWKHEGVCSTPTVEGDRVYYVSNRCVVVCADAEGMANGNQGIQTEKYKEATDEDVIWEFDMIGQLNVFPHNMSACSPLIVGDIIYVVTANGVDESHITIPSPEAPSFIALDKKTGKLLWKSNAPGMNIMHGQWSNPVYAEIDGKRQIIFPGGDGWLYSFTPEKGELIWKFDCNPKDAKYELGGTGTKSDFIGTPVVYDNKVYVGIGQDPEHTSGIAAFYCIAPTKTGDISKTTITGRDNEGKPQGEKPNPNSCEVWRYGGVEEGKWAPRDYKFGRTMSTACIVDDVVYISELQGFLHCLDAKTGKHFWQYDTKASIWGSPYYADGKIFLNNDNDLFIFKHEKQHDVFDEIAAAKDAKTMKEAREAMKKVRAEVEKKYLLSKTEFDATIHSTPVIANGVLYIMTEKSLYAITCTK
jgi:outer membrane protein assembly factor BamB